MAEGGQGYYLWPDLSAPTACTSAAGTQVKREALPELLNLLSPVVCSWDLFAQQIRVPATQISQIKAANPKTGPNYLYTCLTQALEWWVANHGNPVYESMIAVLDPGMGKVTPVMNRALASELREFMAKQAAMLPMAAAGPPTASPGLQAPPTVTVRFTQMNEFIIQGKFASLLEFVQSKLQQRLGAEKIKRELRLFVIRLFNLPANSIPVSSDVAVIFEAMRSHKLLTYLNVAGLEQVIKHFCEGDSETESKMEQYKKDQSGFELAIKIKDYICKARSKFPYGCDESASELQPKRTRAYLTELAVRLEHCVAEYHLVYLRELWKSLSDVLSVPPLYLILDAVIMNSVLVVWLIPTDMVPEAIERAKQNTDFFRKYPILKVTIGDECVFRKTEPTAAFAFGKSFGEFSMAECKVAFAKFSTDERKLEFGTMLKRVADQFRPEDVEVLAFIHHLPATEPRTALGALCWMERKGMFSHNNVDPLVQLLHRISRSDIIYNCGVKEYMYQEQQWEPERLELSEVSVGSWPKEDTHPVSYPTSPSDDPLSSLSQQQKKKLLERIASDEHMRTELGYLPAGSSSGIVTGTSQAHVPQSHDLPLDLLESSVQKDTITWKVKRSHLIQIIISPKKKTFSKQLKVRAVGARPVTLKFILHACGIGHDKNNSASLEVLVAVNSSRKYQPLKHMARLNLEITVQMDDSKEFLATRSVCKELSDFCIHDFLPHEVIFNSEYKVQNIEIKAEAYLRYDLENLPEHVSECGIIGVTVESSTALQQH